MNDTSHKRSILKAFGFLARRNEGERAKCINEYMSTRTELQQRQKFKGAEYNWLNIDAANKTLVAQGAWTVTHLVSIRNFLKTLSLNSGTSWILDCGEIQALDSSGAWELLKLIKSFLKKNVQISLKNLNAEHQMLIKLVSEQASQFSKIPKREVLPWLARLGERTVNKIREFLTFLNFFGEISFFILRVFRFPKRLRWRSICSTIETTGYQALPIIALLSFMIGIVLTYQTGIQLKNYGANIYIVDILGIGVLREFGPLLTAIMVAGRTGSAFTAQLGTMKINEELDALRTIGINPSELLVIPKLLGLLIALPLLTVWANIFGLLGGMVMANNMLDISWIDFLTRFEQVISLNSLMVGISKTPVFAIIIASIGCFQGSRVGGSADSVGKQTTKSVVQAIFFIIIADAIFSVLFSKYNI